MQAKSHFLSRMVEDEKRQTPRRQIRLTCKIFYLRNGLRGYRSQDVVMLNISEAGCLLNCRLAAVVPQHFYVVIEGIPFKFACALVEKDSNNIHTSFIQEIPAEIVEQLIRKSRPAMN